LHSYTFVRPTRIPAVDFYVVDISLPLLSTFLFDYLQRKFLGKVGPKGSQTSDSTLEENRSVKEFKMPSGGDSTEQHKEQRLETEERLPARATPEFMLEIFTSYKRETITKKAALYLLMTYYNLSEGEALELFEKE
jgi:hypothetical protein